MSGTKPASPSEISPALARQRGMTLLELMFVLTIAGVLMAVALPYLQNVVDNNRVVSYRDSLAGGIKMTRNEAVNTQSVVVICPSNNQSTCGGDWADGWIVFVDEDESGGRTVADERLVDTGDGNPGVAVGNGAALASISFGATGINLGNAATIGICDAQSNPAINGRSILLTATGALSYSNAVADANCPSP